MGVGQVLRSVTWVAVGMLLALAWPLPLATAEEGAVVNGGFENDDDLDTVPDGWTPRGAVVVRGVEARSGDWGLTLAQTPAMRASAASTPIEGEFGQRFTTFAWLRADQGVARLTIEVYDAEGRLLTSYGGPGSGRDWTFVDFDIVLPPCAASFAIVIEALGSMALVHADDVDVVLVSPSPGPNQLQNACFEDGLAGWSFGADGGCESGAVRAAASPVHSGSRALELDDRSTSAACSHAQRVPASPGHLYRAGGWVRVVSGVASLRIEYQGSDGVEFGYASRDVSAGLAWRYVEFTVSTPEGTASIDFRPYGATGNAGRSLWDDVSLVDLGPDPAFEPGRLVNGGFEDGLSGWSAGSPGGCPGGSVSVVSSPARSGTGALRLRDASSTAACSHAQRVAVQAGTSYTASAWVLVAGGVSSLRLEWESAGGVEFAQDVTTQEATASYVPVTLSALAPTGAAWVEVRLYSPTSTTGDAYWDDVTLEPT